jgi:hypothetical protein
LLDIAKKGKIISRKRIKFLKRVEVRADQQETGKRGTEEVANQ